MDKQIIIKVQSGLNNKLLPLLSALRIAIKYNYNIKCFWSNVCMGLIKVKKGYHFLDFFESIENIDFIDECEFNKLSKNNNCILHKIDGHNHEAYRKASHINDLTKSHIFINICHVISLKDDNVLNKYIPSRRTYVETCSFTEDFRLYLKYLKPKKDIIDKINKETLNFNDKILGVHVRITDTPICIGFSGIDYKKSIKYIENFLKKNPDWKIYISADCLKVENHFIDKFKEKIIKFNNPFGTHYNDKFNINSYDGIKNGICEMYILSKCSKIIGTPSSSFSLMAWLLSSHKDLDYS